MASAPERADMRSCEVCGVTDLAADEFAEHTQGCHIDGRLECPFCGLAVAVAAELYAHVPAAHPELLTPERDVDIWCCVSGGADGSPRRSALDLKLDGGRIRCPLCRYAGDSPGELEEHVNRRHFDPTSPSVGGSAINEEMSFPCPICAGSFGSGAELELHVNVEHKDVLSPASGQTCPVCGVTLEDNDNAARHVEQHFPPTPAAADASPSPSSAPLGSAADPDRERRDFEALRAQYGMDCQGNFGEQSAANMRRAVYAGEMTVADYYERTLDLRQAESAGVDDGSSATRSLASRLRALSSNSADVRRALVCSAVDHYASSYGDRGWGCGYRNAQMLISALLTRTEYNERLRAALNPRKRSCSEVPSIPRLQQLIEEAWARGFDLQGSEQLGSRLVNTRKWIGATEVVTLLSYLRIRCQLVDFHRPTGAAGTHPELFRWVFKYFDDHSAKDFTPPLYLQHQGHSRTIAGIEVHKDGSLVLLLLDPSHQTQQMSRLRDTETGSQALRLLRKGESYMKAKQYQIVAVVGTTDTEQQYQQSKVLRGLRIPQDR